MNWNDEQQRRQEALRKANNAGLVQPTYLETVDLGAAKNNGPGEVG